MQLFTGRLRNQQLSTAALDLFVVSNFSLGFLVGVLRDLQQF
jgi:hypothetical protein